MDLPGVRRRFAADAKTLATLVEGVDEELSVWRQAPGKWSLVEIFMHLWDEEKEDFRVRLEYTLHRPGEAWPSIDPESWVTSRNYGDRNLGEALAGFLEEREASLRYLGGLRTPDLDRTHTRKGLGTFRAGDVLAAWSVHDLLHLRQITRLLFDHAVVRGTPYDVAYAGAWPREEER
jgi:hypothetical protein